MPANSRHPKRSNPSLLVRRKQICAFTIGQKTDSLLATAVAILPATVVNREGMLR